MQGFFEKSLASVLAVGEKPDHLRTGVVDAAERGRSRFGLWLHVRAADVEIAALQIGGAEFLRLEDVPDFLEKKSEEKPLNDAELSEDFEGWKAVLEEHDHAFNIEPLEIIRENVNRLITWHITETPVLTHGDFHLENQLTDSNGNILICDWQGVRCGAPSSDISFFISRLSADGITINNTHFLKSYADAILKLSGRKISINDISRHITAANVITSYRFWHRFLHNNPEDRVREIYSAMTTDFHRIFPEEK